jgi:hypothetical protein
MGARASKEAIEAMKRRDKDINSIGEQYAVAKKLRMVRTLPVYVHRCEHKDTGASRAV